MFWEEKKAKEKKNKEKLNAPNRKGKYWNATKKKVSRIDFLHGHWICTPIWKKNFSDFVTSSLLLAYKKTSCFVAHITKLVRTQLQIIIYKMFIYKNLIDRVNCLDSRWSFILCCFAEILPVVCTIFLILHQFPRNSTKRISTN